MNFPQNNNMFFMLNKQVPNPMQINNSPMQMQNNILQQNNMPPQSQLQQMSITTTASSNTSSKSQAKIQVMVRKRPLNKKEQTMNEQDIITVQDSQTVIVKETRTKVDLTKYIEESYFNFNAAFDENGSNEEIYLQMVRPLVEASFQKYKVTCFAYGQTGSGKTFTMMGDTENNDIKTPGLYLLAAHDIFQTLKNKEYSNFSIAISFYEIYCGKLHDLLNDRKQLFVREDARNNINIVGLQEKPVMSVQQLMQIIEYGLTVRVSGQTGANEDSSRSHAILQITLKDGKQKLHGKITFIDLAGSERAADVTDQDKQTRIDGAEINKSLLALKECIRALDQEKKHTPFRGSKLTLVLKDSFIGQCKTLMIACISPTLQNSEHTLNTLRYADRVKELKKDKGADFKQLSDLDLLAKQLMLPRQEKNTVKKQVVLDPLAAQNEQQYDDMNNIFGTGFQNSKSQKNLMGQNQLGGGGMYEQNLLPPQQNQQFYGLNLKQSSSQNKVPDPNSFLNQQPKRPTTPQYNSQMTQAQPSSLQQGKINLSNFNPQQNTQQLQIGMSPQKQQLQQGQQQNQYQQPSQKQLFLGQNNNNMYQQQQQKQMQQQMQHQQLLDEGGNNQLYQTLEKIQNWQAQSEEDLQIMSQKHEQLIGKILAEEEDVIASHRLHIDSMVELVKQEMMLLHEVDKPGSDVDEYVQNLDVLLTHKMDVIAQLKNQLKQFKDHLLEEEALSKKFYEQRQKILDVFDLNQVGNNNGNNFLEGDDQLLDDFN